MNTVFRSIDSMKVLQDMGVGLLNRIYRIRGQRIANGKSEFLTDMDLFKVRFKVKKKFPDQPNLEKIDGGYIFTNRAEEVKQEFQLMHDLLSDVYDYFQASTEVLLEITSFSTDINLCRNRALIENTFGLMTTVMRVVLMTRALDDKECSVALFCAAEVLLDPETNPIPAQRIKILLDTCADPRCFVDMFKPLKHTLELMLLELRPGLSLLEDPIQLSSQSLLNPLQDTDMGLPPSPQMRGVHWNPGLDPFVELRAAEQYVVFVFFAFLGCPALLFEEGLIELLRTVTGRRVLVPLWRDLSLNMHLELERVSENFPTPEDGIVVPKKFKLKTVLKTLSRRSVSEAGTRQRTTRSLLVNEMRTLLSLLKICPGLLAPQFPRVLAVGTLAQVEISAFFRHYEPFAVRKDTKGFYDSTHFQSDDIAVLVSLSEQLTRCLLSPSSQATVDAYYLEYLVYTHLVELEPLVAAFLAKAPQLKAVLSAPLVDLRKLKNLFESGGGVDSALKKKEIGGLLESLRVNWGRVSTVLCSKHSYPDLHQLLQTEEDKMSLVVAAEAPKVNEKPAESGADDDSFPSDDDDEPSEGPPDDDDKAAEPPAGQTQQQQPGPLNFFDALASKMAVLVEHSLYIASTEVTLLKPFLSLHEVGWFRQTLMSVYSNTVKDPKLAGHGLSCFFLLQHFYLSVHSDCKEELKEMGEKLLVFCNTMVKDLAVYVLLLLKHLWDHLDALDSQTQPLEAGKRIQRSVLSRVAGEDQNEELLPGSESEAWAKPQIEKLVYIRQSLTWILAAAKEKGRFQVYTREYRLDLLLVEQMARFLRSKLLEIFLPNPVTPPHPEESQAEEESEVEAGPKEVHRFSDSTRRLLSLCRANQQLLLCLDRDLGCLLQDLFATEFQDSMTISPPGLPLPLHPELSRERLITQLADYFVSVVGQLSDGNVSTDAKEDSSLVTIWTHTTASFVSVYSNRASRDKVKTPKKSDKNKSPAPPPTRSSAHTPLEQFLAPEQLRSLVSVVGIQGFRAIQAKLTSFIADQVLTLLRFVDFFKGYYKLLERNYCLSLSAVSGVKRLPELFQTLKTIGIALSLRQMLNTAMAAVCATKIPDIASALSMANQSLDPWGDPQLLSVWACLSQDLGLDTERDLALSAALAALPELLDPLMREAMSLFPVAAASMFMCEEWGEAHYLPAFHACDRNEHLIARAVAALKSLFFTLLHTGEGHAYLSPLEHEPEPSVTENTEGGETRDPGAEDETQGRSFLSQPQERKAAFLTYVDRYLRISSQILLTLRTMDPEGQVEAAKSSSLPFRVMSQQLTYFVDCLPAVGASLLEQHFPRALLRADVLDLSLGRQVASDPLQKFSHVEV